MCWKRLLRVPWTERKSNQSILREINPEYSLEGLMLKLQYFGDLMWRADSLEKTLILGKIESRRQSGVTEDKIVGWHHHLNGHEFDLQTLGDSEGQGSLVCCSPWGCKESDTTYWLNNNSPESYSVQSASPTSGRREILNPSPLKPSASTQGERKTQKHLWSSQSRAH